MFVDDQASLFIPVISEKRRREEYPAPEAHFDGGIHGVALNAGLLLCNAGKHHQLHFALHFQRKQVFTLKAHTYRWI